MSSPYLDRLLRAAMRRRDLDTLALRALMRPPTSSDSPLPAGHRQDRLHRPHRAVLPNPEVDRRASGETPSPSRRSRAQAGLAVGTISGCGRIADWMELPRLSACSDSGPLTSTPSRLLAVGPAKPSRFHCRSSSDTWDPTGASPTCSARPRSARSPRAVARPLAKCTLLRPFLASAARTRRWITRRSREPGAPETRDPSGWAAPTPIARLQAPGTGARTWKLDECNRRDDRGDRT